MSGFSIPLEAPHFFGVTVKVQPWGDGNADLAAHDQPNACDLRQSRTAALLLAKVVRLIEFIKRTFEARREYML